MGPPLGALTRRRLVLGPDFAGPAGDRTDGVRPHDRLTATAGRPHGLVPARRHEAGCEVAQGREHEQSLVGLGMGHHQQVGGLAGVERYALGRTIQRQPGTSEDQEVEVELPRTPAFAILAPEGALKLLQRHEQGDRPGRRARTGRHIKGHDRIAEVRLVRDADRPGGIQARNAPQPCPR